MSELKTAIQSVLDRIDQKEKEMAVLSSYIPVLEEFLMMLKKTVNHSTEPMTPVLVPASAPVLEPVPAPTPPAPEPTAALKKQDAPPTLVKLSPQEELEELKKLLESKNWPQAVAPDLIVNDESENDKFERAEGIVEITLPQQEREISILDIGCGEGHFLVKAVEKGYKKAVGYDLQKPEKTNFEWERFDGKKLLTTSWDEATKQGPYNVVVLFDVLDHIKGESPIDLLKKAKSVLAPKGTVFVRCHPWCSRHGAHLYKKINKAWVQLVLTEEELSKLGYTLEPHGNVLSPRKIYEGWFQSSGLKIANLETDRTTVEQFFMNTPLVKSRIINAYKGTGIQGFPQFQMEQSFLDYTLRGD